MKYVASLSIQVEILYTARYKFDLRRLNFPFPFHGFFSKSHGPFSVTVKNSRLLPMNIFHGYFTGPKSSSVFMHKQATYRLTMSCHGKFMGKLVCKVLDYTTTCVLSKVFTNKAAVTKMLANKL